MQKLFEVVRRNPHHWDIWAKDMNRNRRVYRIRGSKGDIVLQGDHDYSDKPERRFSSIESCMTEVCAEFMQEKD